MSSVELLPHQRSLAEKLHGIVKCAQSGGIHHCQHAGEVFMGSGFTHTVVAIAENLGLAPGTFIEPKPMKTQTVHYFKWASVTDGPMTKPVTEEEASSPFYVWRIEPYRIYHRERFRPIFDSNAVILFTTDVWSFAARGKILTNERLDDIFKHGRQILR